MGLPARYNMRFLWTICVVAALGGLLFGYDWVVIGGAKPFYEPYFGISGRPLLQGLAMSSALIGCLCGAVLGGLLSDRFGRRRPLILSGLLFTASAIGTAASWGFLSFNVFRWLGGVAIGLASNLSPLYIAEVSPGEVRGKFVSINQLTIVIGILAAQLVNWRIAQPVPTADQLRILLSSDAQIRAVHGPDFDVAQARLEAMRRADVAGLQAIGRQLTGTTPGPAGGRTLTDLQQLADEELLATYIRPTWNGQRGWRWMFAAETAPALAFFLLMFLVPESPRWLVKYGHTEPARAILARVGGAQHAHAEVASIEATLGKEEIGQVHFSALLEPRLLRILGLGVFLVVFQQWCGINVIFNYAQEVFEQAGYGVSDIMWNIVITGVVNLVFTFVAIYTVDRFGRRALMLIGAGGLTGIYAVLGTGYYLESQGVHMLVLVVLAIACYAMSLAPVTWVLVSEIFPNRIRGAAMSVAVFSLWGACTVLTFTFPILKATLGAHGVFWLYGAICVIGFVVILAKLPETKGKSLEQIERELAP